MILIFIDHIANAIARCIKTGFTSIFRGFVGVFNDDLLEFVNGVCITHFRLLHSVRIKFDLILIVSEFIHLFLNKFELI